MSKYLKFVAPAHTSDIHVQGQQFIVDEEGNISVDKDADQGLINEIRAAGFEPYEAPKPTPASTGTATTATATDKK